MFLSTNSAIFNNSLVGMVSSSLYFKAPVSAVQPTSYGVLGYKPIISAVNKMAFSGIESRLLIFLMKYTES